MKKLIIMMKQNVRLTGVHINAFRFWATELVRVTKEDRKTKTLPSLSLMYCNN